MHPTLEAQGSLLTIVQKHPKISSFLTGHKKNIQKCGLQPGRQDPGLGERDETIILWDVATGSPWARP